MCCRQDGPEINALLMVQLGRHIIVYTEKEGGVSVKKKEATG